MTSLVYTTQLRLAQHSSSSFVPSQLAFSDFVKMATRGQVTKDLLGDPESVLDAKLLEAYHAGEEYSHIKPWDFKNRPQLPTRK